MQDKNLSNGRLDYSGPRSSAAITRRTTVLGIFAVVGLVLGLLASSQLSLKWTASTLIQIAQAAGAGVIDNASVLQRIQFNGFVPDVLKAAGLPINTREDRRSRLVLSSLKASLPKIGNQIELRVDGYSEEDATRVLDAAVAILKKEHGDILAPTINRQQATLKEVGRNLENAIDERRKVLDSIKAAAVSPERRFSENVMLSEMLRANESEVRALRQQQLIIQEQLDPARTFNTKMIVSIYVPSEPPRRPYAIGAMVGALIGLMLGVSVLFLCDRAFRRMLIGLISDSTMERSA